MGATVNESRIGVEKLYEDFPYPDHGVIGSTVANLLAGSLGSVSGRLRILDIGCGTGEQTLGVKRVFPDADVVGVDLSEASLERARFYADRARLKVTFQRHDLLNRKINADQIGTFDAVVCVGVLHHLPVPGDGLRSLLSLAAPNAILLGMVYGSFGREATFTRRDAFSRLSASSDREERLAGILGWRRSRVDRIVDLMHLWSMRRQFGPDISRTEALHRLIVGRNQADLADTYTHVIEHAYTWAELVDVGEMSGWKIVGWPERSGMPDHPDQLFRGDALTRAREMTDWVELAGVYERLVRPGNLFFTARPSLTGSNVSGGSD